MGGFASFFLLILFSSFLSSRPVYCRGKSRKACLQHPFANRRAKNGKSRQRKHLHEEEKKKREGEKGGGKINSLNYDRAELTDRPTVVDVLERRGEI